MTDPEKARLMLLCGCLHDISEKAKEETTARQVKTVQLLIQKDILGYPNFEEPEFNWDQRILIIGRGSS